MTPAIAPPLNPYDRIDLRRFVLRVEEMPPPPSAVSGKPADVSRWLTSVGPIETSELQQIQAAMTKLLRFNGSTINGARQWLGIDGPPMSGKTFAAVVAAMRIDTELRISQAGTVKDPFEHIPVIVVSGNLGEPALARTLLDNMARFIGVVLPSGLAAAIAAMAHHIRNVGTLLVVVDDAHFIKRKSGSRNLTDALKDIISTLPTSFVFVGAGLGESALLHVPSEQQAPHRDQFSAVHQLRERLILHEVKLFPPTALGDPHRVLKSRMMSMLKQFDRIEGFDTTELRSDPALKRISARSLGKTGLALSLLARTASSAAEAGITPTVEHVARFTAIELPDA